MKRHVLVMHGDRTYKPFKCDQDQCSYATNSKGNLDLHRARCLEKGLHKDVKEYICQACKRIFPANKRAEYDYVKHCRTAHNDIPPEFMDRKQYLCSECPEIYFNKESFNTHIWKHR